MEKDITMQRTVRVKARGYMKALLRYETILTAQIFLPIFAETTPLSKYLQTSGMNLLTAQRMVMGTEDKLKRFSQDFEDVKKQQIHLYSGQTTIYRSRMIMTLRYKQPSQKKRQRKKKVMPGEIAEDETLLDSLRKFRVKVHNVIIDTVQDRIFRRYTVSAALCSDFACMDPEIQQKGLP